MDRIEIQRALYDARNGYLKAKTLMQYYAREGRRLKQCERNLGKDTDWLYNELFGDTPLGEEVYGG